MASDPDPQPFVEAVRQFLAAAHTPDAAAAARTFTDFLTDQYAAPCFSWHVAPGDGAATHAGLGNGFAALGPTRQHQERAQRLTASAIRYAEAQLRLQRHWSDLLSEAATRFAARTMAAAFNQQTTAGLHELFDRWIDTAEEVYSRAARSDSFCNALAESVNAMSEWRRDMQANMEDAAKLFDLPTRSELDSLARRVKALEAELRAARVVRKPPKAARRRRARTTSEP